jgi:streptogramin lyase
MKGRHLVSWAAFVLTGAAGAQAATFTGTVRDDGGKAVAGAVVSVGDDKSGITESAYTDAEGRFALETRLSGSLSLKVRRPYFADVIGAVEVTKDGVTRKDLVAARLTTPEEISDSLPAAYHFARIRFEPGTPFARDQFQRDCLTCHQIGNEFTRWKRTPQEWDETIKRMHAYLGNFDGDLRAKRSELLAHAFDGTPTPLRPTLPADPLLAHARLTEYRLDQGQIPHDAEVDPEDGLVYTVDQQAETMAVTNLDTGHTDYVPAPHDGMNPGGKFARMGLKPLLDVYRGPHSLSRGLDGKWYVTDTISSDIGVFDPKTKSWGKSFEIGGNSLYPHTIRTDAKGLIWFTIIATNEVGRLDPTTGKVTVVPLPQDPGTAMSPSNAPYGIDVDPKDGGIWYAKLFADRIGRIDPVTLAVTEHVSPVKGPRRMRFDKSGHLWVAGYSEGVIARITTADFTSELFPMPEFAPGVRPAPYALGVHPDTQDVWVNETMTDHIYRLIPGEKRWVAYPMPLRGTYTRDTSFTKDGRVCMSNNPIPVAALEGGVAELICLQPEAGTPVNVN